MLFSLSTAAQDKLEFGLFGGVSYYMGELNPHTQFSHSRPAIGGLARYAFTDRLAAKVAITAAGIAGDYPDHDDLYVNWAGTTYSMTDEEGNVVSTTDRSYSFDRTLVDIVAMGEFNFRSYDHIFRQDESRFTPYLTLGIGATCYKRYEDGDDGKTVFVLSLPFGLGAKYKVNKWLRLGLEWRMHKTFVDDLDFVGEEDGKIDPSDPYGFDSSNYLNNNDWYSIVGVSVTVGMWPRKLSCNDGTRSFNR